MGQKVIFEELPPEAIKGVWWWEGDENGEHRVVLEALNVTPTLKVFLADNPGTYAHGIVGEQGQVLITGLWCEEHGWEPTVGLLQVCQFFSLSHPKVLRIED